MTTAVHAKILIEITDPDEHKEQELQLAELIQKARKVAIARELAQVIVQVRYPQWGNADLLEIDFSGVHIRTLPPDDVVEE